MLNRKALHAGEHGDAVAVLDKERLQQEQLHTWEQVARLVVRGCFRVSLVCWGAEGMSRVFGAVG